MACENEKYNGWTNRETWALFLHLTNNEAMYREVLEVLKDGNEMDRSLGEDTLHKEKALKIYVDELRGELEDMEIVKLLIRDVGSFWRVNWKEIVQAFTEDLQ